MYGLEQKDSYSKSHLGDSVNQLLEYTRIDEYAKNMYRTHRDF